MDIKSLWDQYDEIMSDTTKWCYFTELHPHQTSQDLFTGTNALDYIKSTFEIAGKSKALEITYDNRFTMNQYRSNHTLSAYLLGILLRDKLHINMTELPKVTEFPKRNFLYFWSLTCLYHDFAFSLEEETKKGSSEYKIKLSSINDFIEYFNIEYSLINASAEGTLIQNYYNYVFNEIGHVDHGIAGAMLFYDALLKEYNLAKKHMGISKKESFEYNGKRFSSEFEKHVILIANTIAKHNMWRASSQTEERYMQYGLRELIPQKNGAHLISLDDESENDKEKLLFLLGLVDTLEPIKNLGRDENNNPIHNPYIVLEKMKVRIDYQHKKISIICPTNLKDDYFRSIRSISSWMNVSFVENAENTFEITILNRKANADIAA